MTETNPELTKPTSHSNSVKNYMKNRNLSEQTARDLVARDLMIERKEKQADFDPLTGLLNRRWLDRELSKIFETTSLQNEAFTVLALDIDHFKKINDENGHQEGDNVLINLARILQNNVRSAERNIVSDDNQRSTDTVVHINGETVRSGGEEFLVVLSKTKDLSQEQILGIANRLRTAIAEDKKFSIEINPTVSIGIATYDSTDEKSPIKDPETLLGFADKALYNAKETGRNKAVMFSGLSQKREPMFIDTF